jgi:hypothetical protein
MHEEYSSCDITVDDIDLVFKFSWAPLNSADIEAKMFEDCGGMFGVADHYSLFILSHQPDHISTNRLLLPEEAMPYGAKKNAKDHRAQWVHVTKFAGEPLVNAKTPRMLIKSVVHAIPW